MEALKLCTGVVLRILAEARLPDNAVDASSLKRTLDWQMIILNGQLSFMPWPFGYPKVLQHQMQNLPLKRIRSRSRCIQDSMQLASLGGLCQESCSRSQQCNCMAEMNSDVVVQMSKQRLSLHVQWLLLWTSQPASAATAALLPVMQNLVQMEFASA